jgi:hypothetical protein
MKTRTIVTSIVLLAAVTSAACGDDRASSSGGSAPPINTGNGSSSSSGGAIARRPNPERLCEPLAQRGAEIVEYALPKEAKQAVGGAIKPGTYVLHALEEYTGAVQLDPAQDEHLQLAATAGRGTGRVARVTLYVTRDALRFNESRADSGSPPEAISTRGFSYRAEGTQLALTAECPSGGTRSSISYTASGDWLTLYVDGTHAEVYTRIP